MRIRVAAVAVAAAAIAFAAGCPNNAAKQSVPLEIAVDASTLEANGTDRTRVVATAHGETDGVVVSFSATGGFLSSSAMAPDANGVAAVDLVADREEALLGRPSKPVTIRATITRTKDVVETATVDVTFVAPTSGAPTLNVVADPAAAVADGASTVNVNVTGRRLTAGTHVTLSTSAGVLGATDVALDDDGAGGVTGTTTLLAPSSPADAIVTVRADGVDDAPPTTATTSVSFVEDGAAQFDLTGTFAQFTPARIKMSAATLTPNPQCVVAPAYVKVDVVQNGAHIDATYTTCFVTLVPVKSIAGDVTETVPPAFVGAIPQVHASFDLEDVALGASYDPPKSVVVSGANLDDPINDDLPTSADDPRVVDADNDGEPGVTVTNSLAGDQNVTFRNTGDTVGAIESQNRILGDVVGDLSALPESSVLGAGNAFLPDMQNVPSVWEMVRVDGKNGAPDMDTNGDGAVSCQEIVDAASFLFTVQAPSTPLDCEGVN